MVEKLLEESDFVREKAAKARAMGFAIGFAQGKAEGLVEGEEKGKIELARQFIVEVVQTRFPSLADELQQEIGQIKELTFLCYMVSDFFAATDENAIQSLLKRLKV